MKLSLARAVFAVVGIASAAACYAPTPIYPDPPPYNDASCAPACEHLRHLGCVEGKRTPQGATCEDVCTGEFASGVAQPPTACLTAATDCATVARCR